MQLIVLGYCAEYTGFTMIVHEILPLVRVLAAA